MHKLIKHLATLIHKKKNKNPSSLFLSSLAYIPSENSGHLNIEHLVTTIRARSYKGYLIFSSLDLSPLNISLLYVLTHITRPLLNIPLKKIALGFTNNINIYKDMVDIHIYNILEIIHNNTLLYLNNKQNNYNINKEYEKRVIEQNDDVLDFYIGMYDIYIRMKYPEEGDKYPEEGDKYIKEGDKYIKEGDKYIKEGDKYIKEDIRLEIQKYLELFKKIFLTERSDFLENLFYNFKEIKKMSKMSYIYILQETIRTTFNYKIDLEIILNDSSSNNFNLFINVPRHLENILTREYIFKLSKIFKFMYKMKKVEYLCRRKKNILFSRLISKMYFYICEEVFNSYILEINGDQEYIKRVLDDNIEDIISRIYLNDNMFYKIIKELENTLVRSLVEGIKFSDDYVRDLLEEMYKKTENEIFLI
ncbi:hypothetical protein P3W45_000955 [Vairimorpha bombi]|jgi:hypothetical protein